MMNYLPPLPELLAKCENIVRESGRIILEAWNRPHAIRHKGDTDLVTETDVEVQSFLQKALGELLPEASFLGEEGEGIAADPENELCWIVDPVDGTTNFVHRFPMVATSVALWEKGRPVLGVVNAPVMNELFSGARELGGFLNGRPIRVSATAMLNGALVATGFPYDVESELPDLLRRLKNILPATQGLRRPGSAALDICYVACGRLDAFYENTLKAWDVAGGLAILQEAGGKASAFDLSPYKFGQPLLASNGLLHNSLAALL